MIRTLRSSFLFALCWGLCVVSGLAQSNPTPYNLASGNYSFTSWASTSAPGTYPESMIFHKLVGAGDPTLTTEMNANYDSIYSTTSGTVISGLGANGFSFQNTGFNASTNPRSLGAAVLALNTSGRTNIQVTWTGGTDFPGAAPQRLYAVRLQYRVGTTDAFTDVLSGGNPVEYLSTTTAGNFQTLGPVTLPAAAENQSVVQLRWKYYYVSGSGARPRLRVDDIFVTSQPSAGSPTKLAITTVNPTSPTNTMPFSLTVVAQDASNSPKNVVSATSFTLSLTSGTGTLGGTLTGTIPAGQSQVVISGVTYNKVETGVQITATRTGGDALTSGTSAPFNVQQGATQLAFVNFPTTGYTGFRIANFTVEARKPDGSLDTTYNLPVTLSQLTGTGLQGNLTRTAFRGVALFNDTANVSFANPGTFTLQASSGTLANATSSNITITRTPLLTDLIIPQYIKSGGNTNRVPAFALVRLDSLQPNTTYRYFAGAAGPATSSASIGGGNNMHYDATTGTYVYSTNRALNASGGYSTFKTGSNQRSMEIWLNLIPTTNAAFNVGTDIQWILSLGDSTGVQIARYLTTKTSRAIDFGTTTTTATGIADRMSMLTPKNFIALYDNAAGTGSPVSTSMIQENGVEIGAAALYYAELDGINTSWATIIPNALPNGIRRIEERSINGSLVTIRTDNDGIWNGISTINPAGGLNAIYLETPFISLIYPDTTNVCSTAPLDVRYFARGVDSVSIQVSNNGGTTYQELGRRSGRDSVFSVPTNLQVAGQRYSFRVVATQDGTVGDTSGIFAINTPVMIVRQPRSVSVCEGTQVMLEVIAQGTGLTFQWQKDGVNIPGANQAQFNIPSVQLGDAAAYRVIVSGASPCPSVVSNNAIVFVNRPTRIVQQPENARTLPGGTVRLTAGFEVTEPSTYQWRRNGQILTDNANIIGSNSSVLTIRNVQQSETADLYTVTVNGLCGSATSNPARVSIVNFLITGITPSSAQPCVTGPVTFTGNISKSPTDLPLTYQWYFGSTRLINDSKYSGTLTPVLRINSVSTADTGTYRLIARDNESGTTDTADYRITALNDVPNFILQPSSMSICREDADSLKLTYGLSIPSSFSYVLRLPDGSRLIDTLTSSAGFTIDITNAKAGQYYLQPYSECEFELPGVSFSISFKDTTAITEQPPKQVNATFGTELILNVGASGSGTLAYQWFKNGVAIPNEITSSYSVTSVTEADAGTYTVRVTGECGTVMSDSTVVTVGPNSVEAYTGAPGLALDQNIPNPFSSEASISYTVPTATHATLVVRDIFGRTIQTITFGMVEAGTHTTIINAADVASGTYYYTLQTDTAQITRRLLIVR